MMSQFAFPLPLEVIFRVFGLEPQDLAEAKAGSEAWLRLVSSQLDEQSQAESARSTVGFQQLVAHYVTQRRTAPREDLISDMLAALRPDEQPLTYEQEAELVQNVGGVLLAGHMTTSNPETAAHIKSDV